VNTPEQILTIRHKRGDTFRYRFVLRENSVPVNIQNIGIRSQMRFGSTLIAELIPTKIDEAGGEYELLCLDTTAWPMKTLTCDVQYTLENGDDQSTETFAFEIVRDITLT
jgi:hypothetical protein